MKNDRMFFNWAIAGVLLAGLVAVHTAQTGQVFQGAELEQFLTKAKVTSIRDIGQGVTIPRRAFLEMDGAKHSAVFKTIDEGPVPTKQLDRGVELQFQDSWRTEVAAYELDKILGLGMVPVTIDRTFDGKRGSFQFWIDSVMSEAERVTKKLEPPNALEWNEQVAKVRLFDNLIYNTDRHLNNLRITADWKIRLIDHSRSFRPFEQLKDPKALTRFSRTLLAKLEELNEPLLKDRLGKYLSPYQITGVMKRRDAIIALSKKLVAEKGAGQVLYR
jgi:hypothetical protein